MKFSKKHIILLILMSFSFIAKGQNNSALQTFLADTLLRHAQISLSIRNLSANNDIISYNSQKSAVPASVTKLITTAAALEILGPDYRFQTLLETDGYIDSTGILQGNLYITGNGDPTLGSKYFKDNNDFISQWIKALTDKGIKSINGSIIADVSLYDREAVSPLWLREDIGNYYGAGVFALSLFDNTTTVTLKSTTKKSQPQMLKINPDVFCFYDCNIAVSSGKPNSVYALGDPYSYDRTLCGNMKEHTLLNIKADIPNPPLQLALYLSKELIDNDSGFVSIPPEVSITKPATKRTVLYVYNSPPLSEIIKVVNVFSNNNFAEYLLKHLSLQKDSVANFDTGLKVIRNFWAEKGINTSGLFMYDGSGLSPKNAIHADFITDLLMYMKQQSIYANTFYGSLPVAGRNGTVEFFLKDTPLSGKARIKSGSFRNVQCYAGYMSNNSQEYAFCIMVNNFTGERKKVVQLIEQLLNSVTPAFQGI